METFKKQLDAVCAEYRCVAEIGFCKETNRWREVDLPSRPFYHEYTRMPGYETWMDKYPTCYLNFLASKKRNLYLRMNQLRMKSF